MAQGLMGLQDLLGQSSNASSGGLLGGGVFSQPESRGRRRSRLLNEAISGAGRNPYGQMGAAIGGLLGMAGRSGAEALGIVDKPPEVQRAEAIRQVQQEVADRGLDPTSNPREFGDFVASRFQELGQPQLATRSLLQARQIESQFAPEPKERRLSVTGGSELANQLQSSYGVSVPEGETYEVGLTGDRVTQINRLGASNVQNVNTGDNITPFEEVRGKEAAKSVEEARIAADEASVVENQLIDLQNSLAEPGMQTGSVQGLVTPIQAFADSVGVDTQNWVENATGLDLGNTSDKEEFDRITKDLVTRVFGRFKGNLNDREVRIALGAIPNLGTTFEGNIRAIASMRAAAKLAQERGDSLGAARSAEEANSLRSDFNRASTERYQELISQYEDQIREQVSQSRGTPAPSANGSETGSEIEGPDGTVDWSNM